MAGRFLGVGVDEYEADTLPELEHAVSDVEAFYALLRPHFEGEPLANPDEQAVRDRLKHLKGSMEDGSGALVLIWAGHGVRSLSVRIRLAARDSDPSKDEGFDVDGDLGSASGLSGASQILIIVDTCYSGEAVSAARVVGAIMQAQPPGEAPVWAGVLASSQTLETAQDGLFGRTLRRVLEDGPTTPELRLRWSVQNEFIRGDDLCDAVLKEWDGALQTPQFEGYGSAWWMFPNPLYRPNAPEQVVEHLLLASRGGGRADERSWFTGRTAEVDRVVAWVRSGVPGMHVVTGSAGSGKSAIVGRVVSLSNPRERRRLLDESRDWSHVDPGERSVQAHVHARGLTADRTADLLGDELVRCGLLTSQPERRNASELVGQVQRAVENGGPAPVIVVDGLDEARGEAFSMAEDLLTRLAEHAVVVVSTRELRRGDNRGSLLATLTPQGAELDLDDPAIQEGGRAAMHDYVAVRLAGVDERMDGAAVAAHLTRETSMTSGSPFLLARLVTDRLRERPVDTSLPDWRRQVSGSIDDALDVDLARVEPRRGTDAERDLTASDAARGLLRALTWGLGAGLPEDEWLAIARALLPDIGVDRDDVTWVLDQLGRYVVQDGEDGVAVYRLAHQSLADHLRAPYRPNREQPFDPEALPVARALLDRYTTLLEGGVDVRHPTYLWRYAWRHAALAGPRGVDLLRDLAERAPELVPDVGAAATLVADVASRMDRPLDAVAPTEEALEIYRALAAENPAFQGDLAAALNNLGGRYGEVGRPLDAVALIEGALGIYRGLAAENPAFQGDLAMVLNNLGGRYGEVGRSLDAVALIEEALGIYRALAAENPAFQGDLAMALNNLGGVYGEVGRPLDAVALVEEALGIYRALAAENPAYLRDLAMALNSLSNRYGMVGRPLDAVALVEEALGIYRALAAENPAYRGNLAMVLNNLGRSYSEVGRPLDAVALVEEALGIYRGLAAENPAYRGNLAMALNSLSNRYGEVDRLGDSIRLIEEALGIYRSLAAENPAYLGDLAMALNNLGGRYGMAGRSLDVVALIEEALDIYRGLTAENPAFQGDLAGTLNNLGNLYSAVDRPLDAVALVEEALEIYRGLAAENPVFQGDLAGTLNNLGNRYSALDRPLEAVASSEEAQAIYRRLAAENPVFLGDLAMALNNLGRRYGEVGRPLEAVAPSEEALDIYRSLVAENPVFLGDLAMTLNNLSSHYAAGGEAEHAEACWETTLAHVDSVAGATLLLHRARRAAAGEPRAAEWLTAAIPLAGGDRGLLGAIHDQARRHRDAGTAAFDERWERCTGEGLPAWLTVDGELVMLTRAWIETGTYADERDYLADHPELLADAADVAVAEALMGVIDEEVERYTALRAAARTHGVQDAYEPLLQRILAGRFAASAAADQRALLAEHREALLGEIVTSAIQELVEDEQDSRDRRALALLVLAASGDDAAAFEALEDPSRFATWLAALADRSDPGALAPAAFLAYTASTTPSQAAEAWFFMAVASAIVEEDGDATSSLLERARALDPERAPDWIAQLAELAKRHPPALSLIAQLTTPPDSPALAQTPDAHDPD